MVGETLEEFLTPREKEALTRFQIGEAPPGIASRRDLARLCIAVEGLICDCAQMEMDVKKLKGE